MVTIRVDVFRSVWNRIRFHAAERRVTVSELVNEIFLDWLKKEEVVGAGVFVKCAYCEKDIPARVATYVPLVGDDEAWAELGEWHEPDCEFIQTRAHRKEC